MKRCCLPHTHCARDRFSIGRSPQRTPENPYYLRFFLLSRRDECHRGQSVVVSERRITDELIVGDIRAEQIIPAGSYFGLSGKAYIIQIEHLFPGAAIAGDRVAEAQGDIAHVFHAKVYHILLPFLRKGHRTQYVLTGAVRVSHSRIGFAVTAGEE